VNSRHKCSFLAYAAVLGLAGCHHEGCTRFGDQPCVSPTDWVDCYAAEDGADVRYPCPDMARFCTPQGNWHTCAPYRGDPPAPPPDAGASMADEVPATAASWPRRAEPAIPRVSSGQWSHPAPPRWR
jgi:hypothetical protein